MKISFIQYKSALRKHPSFDFLSPEGFCFNPSEYVILLYSDRKSIIGYVMFSTKKRDGTEELIIWNTATWISPRYRKKGMGSRLNEIFVEELDSLFGHGKYIFESILCSWGGVRIWNHRISLTSNPKSHIYYDEIGGDWTRKARGKYPLKKIPVSKF